MSSPRQNPNRDHPRHNPNPLTRLLSEHVDPVHDGPCNHGTFSPRPISSGSQGPYSPVLRPLAFSGLSPSLGPSASNHLGLETDSISSGRGGRLGSWGIKPNTADLAKHHGVKNPTLMYLSYYVPCVSWIGNYRLSYLPGDIIAGSEYVRSSELQENMLMLFSSINGIILYSNGSIPVR